jgi:multidrug efflux system outer membrane protein
MATAQELRSDSGSRFAELSTDSRSRIAQLPTDSRSRIAEIERITFDEAIRRAVTSHPSVQQAAANVLRSQALLDQARARTRPNLDATFTTTVIEPVTSFAGSNIVPRTQTATTAAFAVPLLTPVRWAERAQAADQVSVSEAAAAATRRAIAMQTGVAYLGVIVQRRVLDLNQAARDNARQHYEFAQQRLEGGLGSRLNAVRAQQELSSDEAAVENARVALTRAQEALGVLVAADHPVDAADEPTFPAPDGADDATLVASRRDIQAIVARETAALRVAADAWKSNLPTATAEVSSQFLAPSGLFADSRSTRAAVVLAIPVFDSGERRAIARERATLVDVVRAERREAERQALSEVRTARESVLGSRRALDHARAAAEQAAEVVRITDVAFREGATTNLELIDAQRRARDADISTAVAEDTLRQAGLELLIATGRFPQ